MYLEDLFYRWSSKKINSDNHNRPIIDPSGIREIIMERGIARNRLIMIVVTIR